MRVDVNISIRPTGQQEYGQRVEMKNMNSWSAITRAIDVEVAMQVEILENGGIVDQETKMWDDSTKTSRVMRSKEDAVDYRYMPEPDLPALDIHETLVNDIRSKGVCIVTDLITKYKKEYGFNKEYINGLIADVLVNQWFTDAVTA
jgi:aspartyl-tRNA(Asn)/glutamyl-tRNA(Gln) amidotransferase subunit B